MTIEDRYIPALDFTSGFPESGDIVGTLGTFKRSEAGQPNCWYRKLRVRLGAVSGVGHGRLISNAQSGERNF